MNTGGAHQVGWDKPGSLPHDPAHKRAYEQPCVDRGREHPEGLGAPLRLGRIGDVRIYRGDHRRHGHPFEKAEHDQIHRRAEQQVGDSQERMRTDAEVKHRHPAPAIDQPADRNLHQHRGQEEAAGHQPELCGGSVVRLSVEQS